VRRSVDGLCQVDVMRRIIVRVVSGVCTQQCASKVSRASKDCSVQYLQRLSCLDSTLGWSRCGLMKLRIVHDLLLFLFLLIPPLRSLNFYCCHGGRPRSGVLLLIQYSSISASTNLIRSHPAMQRRRARNSEQTPRSCPCAIPYSIGDHG
jgi:hypothetical protein